MNALALSAIIFVLTLGRIFLGSRVRNCSDLELSRPFTGLLRLSSAPLRNALGTL
jgi:hypothetical protein